MKHLAIAIIALMMSACSALKATKLNPETGLFPTSNQAFVVTNKPLDIDERKSLILVPDHEFDIAQVTNIGYFDKVITTEDLETEIVKNNLSDKVPSVKDKIGLNNAAKHYKPFLWFRLDTRGSGNDEYVQFILTDPLTLEDYFVTETHMDRVWTGVNDQNNWYPMYNAFIEYIREHSNTYK